ncbi:hypothetical protein CLOACE_01460 [Clostridium acetireducens DSM 10703]|jgi:hypothetical protein|uniref:DUF1835 domain-containing protein n=1 Tax=Clostridium acetireducens DSM 10703 TaxID=1121290 RepID=A0A1E8F1Y5_9CLOT|nr:DUF1835 domain-containing protein [Clostridium acetireducens]OFI07542.1 hypothetical protein CLOACE_01460 [Clostridium acetireducens DSM 10703]
MTKEIIHICCSDSAVGSMKHAIENGLLKGKKVVGFIDDLSNGPIDQLNELGVRIDWCKKIYIEDNEISEEIRSSYRRLQEEIISITDEDIYLWYSNSAKETCGMLYILSMLQQKIQNVYTINVSEITYNAGKRNEFTPMVVGEISPERLSELIEIRKSLDFSRYSSLINFWEKLKIENSSLRVYEGRQVKSVQIDYFDNRILCYIHENFMHSVRIVGEVIGRMESYVSDTFIFWRVMELVKNRKVTYRGKLGVIREMEIKKA